MSKQRTKLAVIDGGDGLPPEPDWSLIYADMMDRDTAHQDWGRVVRELRDAGTLAIANGHAIKRLIEFRVQYERAARHVAEHGMILKGKRAKVGQWNPYWAAMRQADEAVRLLESELGIAP